MQIRFWNIGANCSIITIRYRTSLKTRNPWCRCWRLWWRSSMPESLLHSESSSRIAFTRWSASSRAHSVAAPELIHFPAPALIHIVQKLIFCRHFGIRSWTLIKSVFRRILIRIKVKSRKLWRLILEPCRLTKEPRKLIIGALESLKGQSWQILVADFHHFDEEPGPHQCESWFRVHIKVVRIFNRINTARNLAVE